MSLLKKLSLLSMVGLFLLAFTVVPFGFAQEGEGGANGLQISPTRTDVTAEPGDTKEFTVQVKNITEQNLNLDTALNDFESDNESGSPQIIVDENQERTPYTLDGMLKGLTNLSIPAGQTKDVKLSIEVPDNAVAGAYFGAIRYQAVPGEGLDESKRQIALNASVAHLVFLEIPGDITEQLEVQDLSVNKTENNEIVDSGKFFVSQPNKAAITLKNLGTGFSRPFGKVQVKYWGSEVYSYDLNNTTPRGTILPNSTRIFTDDIANVNKPGKYTIVASVTYGSGGEVATYESTFWYLPWWFIGLIVLAIIALVGGGYWLYRKYSNK